MLLSLMLLCIYVVWVSLTAHARHQAESWGSDRVAFWADAAMRALGGLVGVSLSIPLDELSTELLTNNGKPRCFLVAGSPHGCFPLAQIGLGMLRFRLNPPKGVAHYRLAGADVLFWIPVLREFMLLGGVRSASRKTVLKLLEEGFTVALNPGMPIHPVALVILVVRLSSPPPASF